jgi:hypothetical protein
MSTLQPPNPVPVGPTKYMYEGGGKKYIGNVAEHARRIYFNQIDPAEHGNWHILNAKWIPCDMPQAEIDEVLSYLQSFGGQSITCEMIWRPGVGDFFSCKVNK